MTIAIGTRIALKHDVDRFPHFIAPKGSTGTVTLVEPDGGPLICVRMDDEIDGAKDWENEIHWFDDMNILDDVEVLGMKTRTYMDARFDVTDLTEDERSHLALTVAVQTESDRDNDFPGCDAPEIEWNEVEVEEDAPRTILVHLNVTVPVGDTRDADHIGQVIKAAYEVGSDDDLVRHLDVDIALAEEV